MTDLRNKALIDGLACPLRIADTGLITEVVKMPSSHQSIPTIVARSTYDQYTGVALDSIHLPAQVFSQNL
jgi:hypothetical protein